MTIYLLTSRFPCREKGEAFLIPELKYLPPGTKLVLIPVNQETDQWSVCQPVPAGAEVRPLFRSPFSAREKRRCTLRFCCSAAFGRELLWLIRQGKCSAANLRKLVVYGARALRMADHLALQLRGEADGQSILYSYWMTEAAQAAVIAARRFRLPAVCRAHGGDLYDERNQGYQPLHGEMVRELNRVFPVSGMGQRYLVQHYGHGDRIACRYLGTENAAGARPVSGRRPFCVVSCAYTVPLKRVPLIAGALARLKGDIRWVHFGDGPEMEQLRQIVAGFPPNIHAELRGSVPPEEIRSFYAENEVHLFVNASTTEGIPVSVMEAMSFGIPAAATDVGGTGELVTDGVNGRLLPAQLTEELLAQAIYGFMDMDEQAYAAFRRAAYAAWQTKFNAEANYRAFYAELQGLLPGKENR